MKLTNNTVKTMIEENGFQKTRITCPDGTEAIVSPCFYGSEISDVEQCEYFLIDWDMPWGGESTLEALVNTLNNHAELLKAQEESKSELVKFFDHYQQNGWDSDAFSTFSDWHKDVFGFRPRCTAFGQRINY